MVLATLANLKTKTRRTRGLDEFNEDPNAWYAGEVINCHPEGLIFEFVRKGNGHTVAIRCPFGVPGDVIYVRESFHKYTSGKTIFSFRADNPLAHNAKIWKPSIHLPKDASRIWLKVVSIKVERLHEITEADAESEGMKRGIFREGPNTLKGEYHFELNNHAKYSAGFKYVWFTLHGRNSWDNNPWVWVIEFKVLSVTGKPESIK